MQFRRPLNVGGCHGYHREGSVVPREPETPDPVRLTRLQKGIGVCLLLFYLAMIVITIATLPYVANVDAGFWQLRNAER